jgi:hypothetical protein
MMAEPGGVQCPYCGELAVLKDSAEVYGGRSYGPIWDCRPCDAYVGTHKNSPAHAPLGRLANAELRTWKIRAHAAFDPLWKTGGMGRSDAYALMAELLHIEPRAAHIGMFDVEQCQALVQALAERARAAA